jgi:solute carrier family 44 (choline transporter-like protein), member 1
MPTRAARYKRNAGSSSINQKNMTQTVVVTNSTEIAKENSNESQKDVGIELEKVGEDIATSWWAFLVTSGVAITFSFILLVLFRYAIKYVIWFIYIGVVVLFFIGAVILLVAGSPLGAAIMGGIGLILAFVLCCCKKQIKVVIQLYKETSKVLLDAPLIMIEPILTFVALAFGTIAFLYFFLVTMSSGNPEPVYNSVGKFEKAVFRKNVAMIMSHYVNLMAFTWYTSFIFGCQHFIIACTVCQWYFTRTKSKLDSPISRSFSFLWQFHLGSVCLGALIMLAMRILRVIVEVVKVNGSFSLKFSILIIQIHRNH